jgi:hypothetical protein
MKINYFFNSIRCALVVIIPNLQGLIGEDRFYEIDNYGKF